MAPPPTDFVAIHGHPDTNRSDSPQWLKVAELPGKGRGYIAAQFIPAGTVVHVAKPLVAVVSQEWTPETCGYCFHFTYPKRMKMKLANIKDVSFCSQECHNKFLSEGYDGESDLVLRSYKALEKAYQTVKDKQDEDVMVSAIIPRLPPSLANDDKALADWLNHVWTFVTDDENVRNATWVPSNSERTMCRLIAACLSRRQCESAYLFPGDHHDIVPFSDMEKIQCNEVAYFKSALDESQREEEEENAIPERILEIMRLYIYFSSAVAGILTCPHQLFRAIYFRENANSFGLWEMPHGDSQGVTDDLELLGWGVYPSAVYFNHACDANVRKARDSRNMTFIARRDIEPGQEACISYGSVEESVEERQKRLLEHYHFMCACDRCKHELSIA